VRDPANPLAGGISRQNPIQLHVASSNAGKLEEFRMLASEASGGLKLQLELMPNFSELPEFDESAPTFAENAAGKALHYSQFTALPVVADDSGLAVNVLFGAPGVQSARYAGPGATDAQRISKLLAELNAAAAADRSARFVCVIAFAKCGRMIGIFSDCVEGQIADQPRGRDGFGYDPIFLSRELGKTFAEIPRREKNLCSHRGKAFRKLLQFVPTLGVL